MKKALFFFALSIIALSISAQTHTQSNHSFTLNTIGAGYNCEQKLGFKTTIVGHVGIMTPYLGWSSIDGFGHSINPSIGIEPRLYYNLTKRATLGKSTNLNSANYIALDCEYIFEPISYSNVDKQSGTLFSPIWGLRRVYNDRWLLEFSTGLNCFIGSKSDVAWSPRLNLKFGIVF